MTERLVLTGANVVDVTTGAVAPGQNVVIDDGRIVQIGTDAPAEGARRVDAAGRYVVPGFNDMHAHPLELSDPSGAFELMVAHGITGYRQMSGSDEVLKKRAAGSYTGTATRPALLATPGDLLTPLNTGTEELAVATVRHQKEAGADFIKMGAASAAVYPALQREANRLGIPLGGHLPNETDALEASRSGIRFVEHLGPGVVVLVSCSTDEAGLRRALTGLPQIKLPSMRLPFMGAILNRILKGIVVNPSLRTAPEMAAIMRRSIDTFSEERARQAAAVFIENDTWQSPTLIREKTNELGSDPIWPRDPDLRYVSDKTRKLWDKTAEKFAKLPAETLSTFQDLYATQLRLTRIFAEEGVPMMAGSDVTGASWEIPGGSLHREFDELSTAGLPPLQVLQATTVQAARFLGLEGERGSVSVGASADLVLLDADPTTDSSALHRIAGVVSAGHHHSRADLDAMLERAAKERTAA